MLSVGCWAITFSHVWNFLKFFVEVVDVRFDLFEGLREM